MNLLLKNIRILGLIAIAISLFTWWLDISGIIYQCNYCQTQRTAIGILGIFMLLPNPSHWIIKYLSSVIGFLGATIATQQHFMGLRRVLNGEFIFNDPIYFDSFLLSGFALFIIVGQVLLIWTYSNYLKIRR